MAALTLDLFRSLKTNKKKRPALEGMFAEDNEARGEGSLYPLYEGYPLKGGGFRAPDVTTFDRDGVTSIRGIDDVDAGTGAKLVDPDEGVSLYKSHGKFGYGGWYYFLLPVGTNIDAGLDVVQTTDDESHYSIRCINAMTRDAYQGALNNIARSAIARAVALGKSPLYFDA